MSVIADQPGLGPRSGSGFQWRKGKIRLLVKMDRRAGIVTIASGNARLKRRPRAASESMFGVFTCGDP